VLVNRPGDAKWLTSREKDILEHHLAAERGPNRADHRHTFADALKDPRVYLFAFVYLQTVLSDS
jgi:hypothetical protein